jgi:hypothetical protein
LGRAVRRLPLMRASAGVVAMFVFLAACSDAGTGRTDSAHGSLPPVYPASPLASTNWDGDAGPLMLLAAASGDTAAVVLPEATDSSITSFQGMVPPIGGSTFDLFARGGKLKSGATLVALPPAGSTDCYSWPRARVNDAGASWRVGFIANRVIPVKLDSIEALSSVDSAALAAAITQTAATLPIAVDPAFRGLPFRVRSGFSFTLDSVDIVIADVVRAVNEEANPRIEHLTIIGERAAGSHGKFDAAYYSRSAGAEESTQVMDILAVVKVGSDRHPVVAVGIESENGGRVGFIERTGPGRWALTWRSAYTDC